MKNLDEDRLFGLPDDFGDQEIELLDFSHHDQVYQDKTMRNFTAIIHASGEEGNRIVHFVFDSKGTRIMAKDMNEQIGFKFVKEGTQINKLEVGKKYPVTTNHYKLEGPDGYAFLII